MNIKRKAFLSVLSLSIIILSLYLVNIFIYSGNDNFTIAKGNVLIKKGITEFTPKRKLHEIAHFSGVMIAVPDSFSGNFTTHKLNKNGKEYEINAVLIQENNDSINCKLNAIGSNHIFLETPGFTNTEFTYKKVIINSEIQFQTNQIEWYSTDKF